MGKMKDQIIANLPDESEVQAALAEAWEHRETIAVAKDKLEALWSVLHLAKSLVDSSYFKCGEVHKILLTNALKAYDEASERDDRGYAAWASIKFPKEAS